MKMANEKLTAKKNLPIIVITALGIIAVCLVYLDILFGRWPAPIHSRPYWILGFSLTVGIMLLSFGYWLKTRKRVSEKLTVKNVVTVVVLTAIALLTYCGIILFSLPFTGNVIISWILGLVFASAVILCCTVSMFLKRQRRRIQR